MRFLVKFVLLVSVHKDIDFFSMYEEGFLLVRTNSIEGALAYLKGGAPIDAVVIEASWDHQRTNDLCLAVKKSKPGVKVLMLSGPDGARPETIPADVVVAESLTEPQLAATLLEALVEPHSRESWFSETPQVASATVGAVIPPVLPARAYVRG